MLHRASGRVRAKLGRTSRTLPLLIFWKSVIVSSSQYPAPPWKAHMTRFLLQMALALRPLGVRFKKLFTPAAPEPQDYPFAPTDLAQLLRVTGADRTAELDEPTWRDLLLGRYLDQLGQGVSIFGRQVLFRRLRAGADAHEAQVYAQAQRARIARLLDDPAQLEALSGKLASLRHADIEVA